MKKINWNEELLNEEFEIMNEEVECNSEGTCGGGGCGSVAGGIWTGKGITKW